MGKDLIILKKVAATAKVSFKEEFFLNKFSDLYSC